MVETLSPKERFWVIVTALLALFLGAIDALVMTAAMPTIVAELGSLHLYSWVYSAYFLSRAVSLPIIGKLSDLYSTKRIFLFSIIVFLLASLGAGCAPSMEFLVVARVFQGIGAGGIFALVYIILSQVALPGQRGRTLSFASSVWGIASVIGPTLGGVIVTYFSWRWIFLINIPIALFCLVGIGRFLEEEKRQPTDTHLDVAGVLCLTGFILSFLTIFIIGGRDYPWLSMEVSALGLLSFVFATAFYFVEQRAPDPIIDFKFFTRRDFACGNMATFFSSFAIFALFAYAPLFIQGALGQTPMQVAMAMLSLSLGWSCGSLVLGRFIDGAGVAIAAVVGGAMLICSAVVMLFFSVETSMITCFVLFLVAGLGMGFVTLATLLLVQASLPRENLGVATSLHQFFRTLGGTVGVGICGGIVTTGLLVRLEESVVAIPDKIMAQLADSMENIFQPEFQALLTPNIKELLNTAVAQAMSSVYWIIFGATILCFCSVLFLKKQKTRK